MKKVISIILMAALLTSVFGTINVSYAEETTGTEVYTEMYSLDFDALAVTEETSDQTAVQAAYAEAKFVANSGNWAYYVGEHESGTGDRYIAMRNTAQAGSSLALQLSFASAPFAQNTGKYKLSYNINLKSATANGPYFRVKSYHYAPDGIDNWGPVFQAMYPENGNIKATYSTATTVESHYSAGAIDTENAVQFAADTWHKAEAIIDTDNSKIDYYYDGELVGTQSGETFLAAFVFPAAYFQFGVFNGYDSYDFVCLDNITIAKSTGNTTDLSADEVIVSSDKKEIKISGTSVSGTKLASLVNNTTGEIISANVKSTVDGVKLTTETALADNTEYVIYLDSTTGTICGIITLGTVVSETDEWTELFNYDFTDGNIPTGFNINNSTAATVENEALKLSSTDAVVISIPLETAGNKGITDTTIPAFSGIYELSFDIKLVKSGSYSPQIITYTSNDKKNIEAIPFTINQWDGNFYAPRQSYEWWTYMDSFMTTADQTWHNIRMVMNTNDGTIKYYSGDALLFERANVQWWSDTSYDIREGIDTLKISQEGTAIAGEKTSYIDNVKLRKMDAYAELFSYSFNGESVPEEFSVTSGTFGIDGNALMLTNAGVCEIDLAAAGNKGTENVAIPANSGIYELTFDIKGNIAENGQGPAFQISTSNNEKNLQAIQFCAYQWSPQYAYAVQSYEWWNHIVSFMTPAANTWYSMKLVLDTNQGTVSYYNCDAAGEHLLAAPEKIMWWNDAGDVSYNFSEGIDKIIISHGGALSENITHIDNLTLRKVAVKPEGFYATDAYDTVLPEAKAYNRAIKSISVLTTDVASKADLNAVAVEKDGAAINASADYNEALGAIVVIPEEALKDGVYTVKVLGEEYSFNIADAADAEILDFTLVDVNGGYVAAGDVVEAAALIKGNLEDATLIVAAYDDDMLLDVDYVSITNECNLESILKSLTVPEAENIVVAAYIWDNVSSIKPIAGEPLYLYN